MMNQNLSYLKLNEKYSPWKLNESEISDFGKSFSENIPSLNTDITLLSKLNDAIYQAKDTNEIESKMTELIGLILPVDECNILFWDESKHRLQYLPSDRRSEFDDVVNNLAEEGIVDWIIAEQRTAIIPDLWRSSAFNENACGEGKKNFIIIPLIQSTKDYGIVMLRTNLSKEEISSKQISLISLIANLSFSAIINDMLNKKLIKSEANLNSLKNQISALSRTAVVGEISENLFHLLKNKIQVMLCSIDMLKKNTESDLPAEGFIRQAGEIIQILKNEVSQTSKVLKKISEFSKNISSDYDYGYYSLNTVLTEAVSILESSQNQSRIEIQIVENPKQPQFFGSANDIKQITIYLINGFKKALRKGGKIEVESLMKNDKITITISTKSIIINEEELTDLFNEKSNIKFATAKQLIQSNWGTINTKLDKEKGAAVFITIPKRAWRIHTTG